MICATSYNKHLQLSSLNQEQAYQLGRRVGLYRGVQKCRTFSTDEIAGAPWTIIFLTAQDAAFASRLLFFHCEALLSSNLLTSTGTLHDSVFSFIFPNKTVFVIH